MSGWTTSYRWAGVKRNEIMGLLRHDARNVDRANGKEATHSNTLINSKYTHLNEAWVNDGEGKLVPMTDVSQAIAFLNKKLVEVQPVRKSRDGTMKKIAIRKDANVAVEHVLMLDPRYTRDPNISDDEYDKLTETQRQALPPDIETLSSCRRKDVREKLQAMVDEVIDVMGKDNIIAVTWHWDESHPHVQMLSIPVSEDGHLSYQRKFGAGSKEASVKKYSEFHDSMREKLRRVGYDATSERVDAGRKHQSLNDYKASKKRQRDLFEREQIVENQLAKAAQSTAKSERDCEEAQLMLKAAKKEREEAQKRGFEEGHQEAVNELAKQQEQIDRQRQELHRERVRLDSLIRAQQEAEQRHNEAAEKYNRIAERTSQELRRHVDNIEFPKLFQGYLRYLDHVLQNKGKKEFYQKHFDLYAKRRIREDWQDRKVGLAKNWSTQAGGTGGVSYGIPPQDELGDSMGDDFGL